MAKRYINKKTHVFKFKDAQNVDQKYVLIFGDEIDTKTGAAPSGAGWQNVVYRGRAGEVEKRTWATKGMLEMYFLDVGQGDAAFIVTPNNTKILVDGGLKDRALGFLIWKYRLDNPANTINIDHLILSHGDEDHVEGLIEILKHNQITVSNILHNGIGIFASGAFTHRLGDVVNDRLVTLHDSVANLAG
jgi:beta-lactamase superfamily II metal-dependent hydrolase